MISTANDVSAEWYGVKFTGSSTTGERTGCIENHVSLPLQSQMRGCTISNLDGEVKWLNPTDWTKYEDGTAVPTNSAESLTDSGFEYMVFVPDYYLVFIHSDSDDSDEIRIATEYFEGSTLIKGGYVSAYEGYCTNGPSMLVSRPGHIPTVSTTRASFESYATLGARVEGFHAYTYAMHKAITWLFVVEYACRNSQAAFNSNLTSEGYHQGGLGEGVTTGLNNSQYSFVPCGTTDSLGNNTGIVQWRGASRTYDVPRYRGIENPFGHVWKNTVDTICVGAYAYVTDDPTQFASTSLPSDLSRWVRSDISTGYKWVRRLTIAGQPGDLFADSTGESNDSTYYCDYFYGTNSSSPRTVFIGGVSYDGSYAGLFYLLCSYTVGDSDADVGSRLVYLPS